MELETPTLSVEYDSVLGTPMHPGVLIWEKVRIVWWCIRWGLFWLFLGLGLF